MEDVWREDDTTPGAVEAALRKMFAERHKEERAYVPARVMNMVVIVDKEFRGEIENRLVRVGRYHPSRLIFVAVEPGRQRLSATVRIGTEDAPKAGAISVGRERVELTIGDRHVAKLDTIVDPLVVSDLATMVWAPHGHPGGGRRAAPARADRADRLAGRARRRGRADARRRPLRRHLRGRSRVAALDAVARARRGGVRLPAPAAGAARDRGRDRPPPRGLARLRRCCSAAGCRRGWAGSRARCRRRAGAGAATATPAGRTSRSRSSRSR